MPPPGGVGGRQAFERGHIDVAILQPTYLTEWYTDGFNTTERNAQLVAEAPDRFLLNTRRDPREGDEGMRAFEDKVARYGCSDLNFIVDHVGLPRLEDFCFIAVQEPNVDAGLSVVTGGLMHARPNYFAKVMGELLFFVGEDRMLFGSDYAIWEPQWQVERFVE
ncbi:MAG: amidohydrolase family protein [Acidimicrobiales bacterium]